MYFLQFLALNAVPAQSVDQALGSIVVSVEQGGAGGAGAHQGGGGGDQQLEAIQSGAEFFVIFLADLSLPRSCRG